ncbi:hypothetical protein Naga_100494g3 [Nannochloropsis gaditana]|uniref:Uncharacterized protein n=1 Tax=Nannochloropsis gaditana TaxID=72520 RepID=W7TZF5_9STRA|nr:hypothetical protein Naga_100494g3 [Nannochloropsis gaditana]
MLYCRLIHPQSSPLLPPPQGYLHTHASPLLRLRLLSSPLFRFRGRTGAPLFRCRPCLHAPPPHLPPRPSLPPSIHPPGGFRLFFAILPRPAPAPPSSPFLSLPHRLVRLPGSHRSRRSPPSHPHRGLPPRGASPFRRGLLGCMLCPGGPDGLHGVLPSALRLRRLLLSAPSRGRCALFLAMIFCLSCSLPPSLPPSLLPSLPPSFLFSPRPFLCFRRSLPMLA